MDKCFIVISSNIQNNIIHYGKNAKKNCLQKPELIYLVDLCIQMTIYYTNYTEFVTVEL